MVSIYIAEIHDLPDPLECPEYMERIPQFRREKIKNYKQKKSRVESLGAGLLLEYVLKQYGFDNGQIHWRENGKPEAEGFCFNLSHSNEIVICAIAEKAVGCDVERIKSAPMEVARRYFSAKEYQHLTEKEEDLREEEFYRIWTMKESYVKMTGEGLTLPMDDYEIIFADEVKVLRDGTRQSCFIKEYDWPGYKISVCAEEREFSKLNELTLK